MQSKAVDIVLLDIGENKYLKVVLMKVSPAFDSYMSRLQKQSGVISMRLKFSEWKLEIIPLLTSR